MKNTLIAISLLLAVATGCTSVYTSGCVTTVQNRFFGIQVTSTTATSQMPQITVGAGSSLITIYPTSTNQMYCAPFFSTAQAQTTWNPFDVSLNEIIGAGNVSANISGTNSSATTITPRSVIPNGGVSITK